MAGCFCFCSPKHRPRSKGALISPSHHQVQEAAPGTLFPQPEPTEKADTGVPDVLPARSNLIEDLPVEQLESDLKLKKKKKKVAFNLNVETFGFPAEAVSDHYPERVEEGNQKTADEGETRKAGNLRSRDSPPCGGVSLPPSPPDDRYESCTSSDDEFEDMEAEETDANDDDSPELPGQHNVIEQESSDSLFSLSIDSRKHVSAPQAEETEVTSRMPINSSESARVRSHCVHSVLNPVENPTQCGKPVKPRATSALKNRDKENVKIGQDFAFPVLISPEPGPKPLNQIPTKSTRKENAVHMSLSSWLSEPETTPKSKTSSQSLGNSSSRRSNMLRSAEGRSVLGVLTMGDLRQPSTSTSTRPSRGKSPDDTLMLGTVGNYWSRTGQQWIQVHGHPAEE